MSSKQQGLMNSTYDNKLIGRPCKSAPLRIKPLLLNKEYNMTDVNALKKSLKEAIDAIIEKKSAEGLLDSIAETAEKKLGIKKADFKTLANLQYERIYNEEKFQEKREKIENIYDDLDAVNG